MATHCTALRLPHGLPARRVHAPHPPTGLPASEKSSGRNHCINLDGFGVAWYLPASHVSRREYSADFVKLSRMRLGSGTDGDNKSVASYTTLNPPFNDPNFLQLAHYARSHCLFAHLRASDTPAKYNSLANCHPFIYGAQPLPHPAPPAPASPRPPCCRCRCGRRAGAEPPRPPCLRGWEVVDAFGRARACPAPRRRSFVPRHPLLRSFTSSRPAPRTSCLAPVAAIRRGRRAPLCPQGTSSSCTTAASRTTRW